MQFLTNCPMKEVKTESKMTSVLVCIGNFLDKSIGSTKLHIRELVRNSLVCTDDIDIKFVIVVLLCW